MAIATFEEIRQKKKVPSFKELRGRKYPDWYIEQERRDIAKEPLLGPHRRPDGTITGPGWLGTQPSVNGMVNTEISFGVQINGKEVDIPALVPGLKEKHLNYLRTTPEEDIFTADPAMFKEIRNIAEPFARNRIKKGLSPFKEVPSFEEIRTSVEPTAEDLEKYRRMGVKQYRSPAGKLYDITPEKIEQQTKIGPWEPSLWERIKTRFTTPPPPGGWDRTDRPFRTLGQAALYGLGKYGTGRALYAPKLIDKEIAKKISGFDPTVKEKSIGDFLEFIGGLRSAGKILSPVIGMLPTVSGQAIIGGAGTFGLRNISEQLVDWAATGKTPSLEAFEKDTALGALFGTAEAGLIKFVGFVRGLKGLSKAKLRPARAEVDKAIRHFKKTGDKSLWDEVRIKYAGIEPEVAARIRARAKPAPPVKEFGKYPLAKAPVAPTGRTVAPKVGVKPEKGIKLPLPPKPLQAKPEAPVAEGKVVDYWGRPELKTDYTPKPYIKVTANIAVMNKEGKQVGTKKSTFWAFAKGIKGEGITLQEVTKEGEKKAVITIVNEVDVLKVEQGLVNKKYGELEVIAPTPSALERKPAKELPKNERWLAYEKTTTSPTSAGYMAFISQMKNKFMKAHPESIGAGERILDQDAFTRFIEEKPETKDEYRARIKEVKAKVPEGEISRQPVTVEGKKYYPVSLPVDQISIDAERFQFKLGAKLVGGVTEALKDVERFDPVKGGQIFVWQDKAGKYWVVDGHHRVALAKKTGAEFLETWVVSEKDGVTEQDARAIGALRNLADGKGTAVDAAKLFRDSNISLEELRKNAVPTNSIVVQQGLDMADLSDEVFRLVVDEQLPANMAAAIGKQVKNPTQQKQVADLILEGEVETLRQAELLAATIDSAPILTKTEQTLFGLETTEKSLYAERAKVLANVEQKLKTNKKVFGVLATQTGIIEAKGNILAKVENLATKEKAEEVLFMLEKLANSKGPVAEALNDATKQYAENPTKENLSKVTSELLERWTEGPGRLRIPERKGVPELPLERAAKKVEELNFTQFATKHGYPSDYDITDHSMLSPSGKVSARTKKAAMSQLEGRIAANKKAHREYEEAILAGVIIDPSGKVTKENLQRSIEEKKQRDVKGRLAQIETQIRFLSDVGKSKRGIRPSYQKQIDALRAEREGLRVKPKGKPGFIDVRPLAKVHKSIMNIIEPSKAVEIAYGKEPYATVIKGIHKADVGRIEFNEADIDSLDKSLQDFGELLSKYSKATLTNLMAARGKPFSKGAIFLKNEALKKLAKEAPELIGVRKMITRIADFNYKYLQKVVGDDIHYVEDYFYGIYKDAKRVERFLDHWKTTKRFTKEKKLPTVADALDYGLELRDPNPVNNLRSEYMAVARLDGMIYMRDELLRTGKGKYIDTKEDAPIEWEKVKDPVFKDHRVAPELALLINKLISTNRLRRYPITNALRKVNNFLRTVKFMGSAFHQISIAKQSIADEGYLHFIQPSATRGVTLGFRKNDPIFKTQGYRDYIEHGGGHRYSIASEAQRAFTKFVEGLDKRLGILFKVGGLPIRIPKSYVKWMFQNYIPKVKYAKYADRVVEKEQELGRQLTSPEKIDIIKEQQNFYGMMNERLFGRSGTATTVLRLWFMAPGYAEGNYRTILKSILQWGGKTGYKASRSRSNIINSLLLSAIAATVGTLILTGRPPKAPETREDVRDLFKVDTGMVDDKGRKIMIDLLTYDKDYWNIVGQTLIGYPDKALVAAIKRTGGMVAPTAKMVHDLAALAQGKAIYDWKGDRVTEITDPFARQVLKIVIHEIKRIEPISVSVFKQSLRRDQTAVLSALTSLLGYRPTLTEKDKREQQVLHRIYSLMGQQEELYQYFVSIRNPRKAVERYNKTVDTILSSPMIPQTMRKEWEPKLVIDLDRYLENRAYYLSGQNRTPREIERAKKILENFGVTPAQAQEYLKRYWQRERKKVPVSPLERDRVIGRTRKRKRLQERLEK